MIGLTLGSSGEFQEARISRMKTPYGHLVSGRRSQMMGQEAAERIRRSDRR